nr:LUD domain-containing protein [Halosolutus halophilus]
MVAELHLCMESANLNNAGMTGANFMIAETGSLALITNDGNARKVVESNDVYIAIAGLEKIIPSVADLAPLFELVGRSGTGQALTSYTTILTPGRSAPVAYGRYVHCWHATTTGSDRMSKYDDLFADTAPDESVVVDKRALDPLADPAEIYARESQEHELATILNGVHDGSLPPTVSIYGPPGTGKTLTTRRVCREFASRHDESPSSTSP